MSLDEAFEIEPAARVGYVQFCAESAVADLAAQARGTPALIDPVAVADLVDILSRIAGEIALSHQEHEA